LDVEGTQSICALDMKGLVKVVPRRDPRDKAGDSCVNGFAIDHYSVLLHRRQYAHPKYCRLTIFLKTHQLVSVVRIRNTLSCFPYVRCLMESYFTYFLQFLC